MKNYLFLLGFVLIFLGGKSIIQYKHSSTEILKSKVFVCNIENSLEEQIAKREYFVQWQKQQNAYSAPNRNHNLRFKFKNNGFSAVLRTRKLENNNTNEDSKPADRLKLEKDVLLEVSLDFELLNYGKTNDLKTFQDVKLIVNENVFKSENDDLLIESVNNTDGMRQNYIVKNKPSGNGDLSVNLAVTSNMTPSLNKDVVTFELKDKKHPQTYTYSDLKVWDANQKPLEAHMSLSKENDNNFVISLIVNDKNATYPITIDPIIANGNPSNANTTVQSNQASAWLGASVSNAGDVNGDGYSDIIVGAPYYDNGQSNEGAAFIYHGSATGVSSSASTLLESNQVDANLGFSVSTAGDVNGDGYSDVIVGAQLYDNGQTDEGNAFVYQGSASGISTTASTILQANQATAEFGYSLACAGDVNNDGFSDVIVGARYFDNGQVNEGQAFVYHGSSSGISTTAATILQINQANALFSASLASAGDVNGDGYSDVIIGSIAYANGQTAEGGAFVFHGSSSGISSTATTIIQSNVTNLRIGQSVSSAGDVNGDGYSDVLVSTIQYSNGQSSEGGVFIYHGSSSGISSTAATTLESNQANSFYGIWVNSAGDVNGDGYSDIIVGASRYSNGQLNEGAVFVYHGASTGINTSANSLIESNLALSEMGKSVSSAGDVNGDGYSDVLIGMNLYTNGQTNEGAAFVYHGSGNGISSTIATHLESNQASANFGCSVSSAGDVNGDGYSDVIVGALNYDNGETDEGAAFVYYGSASGISSSIGATLESNQASSNFGISVAGAGDVNGDGYSDVIIGASWFDNGQFNEGVAFVYHGSSTGINSSANVVIESNLAFSNFGYSVATAGDVNGDGYSDVIVGAIGFANGQSSEGAAFVFHGSVSGIGTSVSSILESNQANANMGNSVASAGDVNGDGYSDVIIGAHYYDNGQTNEGAAFVYHGSASGINSSFNAFLESNQADAYLGFSVSGSGDVNGDGYSDIIVSVWYYDNGQTDEGAAFIYHGSASGINSTVATILESNQASAEFGKSVASAGDVNSDGYSDVIVGTPQYDNGQTNEGAAFVFYGSNSGVNTTASHILESNTIGGYISNSVASAGDVNGDGYSDIIVGANTFSNGQSSEGTAYIYHGGGGTGLRNGIRLTNADGSTLINVNNVLENSFGVNFYAKNFLGSDSLQMTWELRAEGLPFSSASSRIDRSVSRTGIETVKTNITTTTNLNEVVSKIPSAFYNKIRVRAKYSMAKAITGQMYGPWRYLAAMQAGNMSHNFVPLPIELSSFEVVKNNCNNKINFTTLEQNLNETIVLEKSENGNVYNAIQVFKNETLNNYQFEDLNPNKDYYYRLKVINNEGKISFSESVFIEKNCFLNQIKINTFPNPSSSFINFEIAPQGSQTLKEIRIFDIKGQLFNVVNYNEKISSVKTYQLDVSSYPKGIYAVSMIFNGKIENIKFIVN